MARRLTGAVCAAVVVVVLGAPVAAARSLATVGSLPVPGVSGSSPYPVEGQVAADGQAVAVGGAPTTGDPTRGAVYVFARPSSGWANVAAPAELLASDGTANSALGLFDGTVAMWGGTVVATARPSENPAASLAYVFERPADGWSGVINERAILTPSAASGCVGIGPVAIARRVVVAGCIEGPSSAPVNPPGAVLVFSEPATGWSGVTNETAELVVPRGYILWTHNPVAISGATIVTDGTSSKYRPGYAFVYREPRRGWRGTIRPAAILSAGTFFNPVAVSGGSVFAAVNSGPIYVFTAPRHGWRGVIHPRARLTYAPPQGTVPSLTASGRRVAVSVDTLGPEHVCPCPGVISAFTEPRHGWSGVIHPTAQATVFSDTGATPLAAFRRELFASGAATAVTIFHLP